MVVECSSGVSTLILAYALSRNQTGHVYSLEHDREYAKRTRELMGEHGLSHFATVIDAPLVEVVAGNVPRRWYDISGLDLPAPIDLLVIDGPPQETGDMARYPAGPILFPRLAAGATVFLDDADRPGERAAFGEWAKDISGICVEILPTEKGLARITFAGSCTSFRSRQSRAVNGE